MAGAARATVVEKRPLCQCCRVLSLFFVLAALDVRVDPRVELVSIVFRLAANPELNTPAAASAYAAEADAYFAPFREHRAVQLAKELRRDRGISHDAIMSFALHLADARAQKPKIPLSPRPPLLEARWQIADFERFLAAVRDFATDSKFPAFAAAHAEHFRAAAEKLSALVNQRDYQGWFERTFGAKKKVKFSVIVGLLAGNGNYGMAVRDHKGNEEITPILGAGELDPKRLPPLIVHELAHCYTNELVDQNEAALLPAAAKLFAANRAIMEQQAYGNAKTLLYESLVRAIVAYYVLSVDGAEPGKEELVSELVRGFKWTKELRSAIADFVAYKARYPTFAEFMPRIAAVLADTARDYDALVARFPRVLSIVPANGAAGVDSATRAIVITFSAPMAPAWSILGGGPSFPPSAGYPHWDPTKTVLTVPVRLEPSRRYEFGLNGFQYHSFVSVDGYPLERMQVSFTTGQ